MDFRYFSKDYSFCARYTETDCVQGHAIPSSSLWVQRNFEVDNFGFVLCEQITTATHTHMQTPYGCERKPVTHGYC